MNGRCDGFGLHLMVTPRGALFLQADVATVPAHRGGRALAGGADVDGRLGPRRGALRVRVVAYMLAGLVAIACLYIVFSCFSDAPPSLRVLTAVYTSAGTAMPPTAARIGTIASAMALVNAFASAQSSRRRLL